MNLANFRRGYMVGLESSVANQPAIPNLNFHAHVASVNGFVKSEMPFALDK